METIAEQNEPLKTDVNVHSGSIEQSPRPLKKKQSKLEIGIESSSQWMEMLLNRNKSNNRNLRSKPIDITPSSPLSAEILKAKRPQSHNFKTNITQKQIYNKVMICRLITEHHCDDIYSSKSPVNQVTAEGVSPADEKQMKKPVPMLGRWFPSMSREEVIKY